MPTGELVRPFAHFAFSFSQKNAAWVGRVCNQHPDPDAWTIYSFTWHETTLATTVTPQPSEPTRYFHSPHFRVRLKTGLVDISSLVSLISGSGPTKSEYGGNSKLLPLFYCQIYYFYVVRKWNIDLYTFNLVIEIADVILDYFYLFF